MKNNSKAIHMDERGYVKEYEKFCLIPLEFEKNEDGVEFVRLLSNGMNNDNLTFVVDVLIDLLERDIKIEK